MNDNMKEIGGYLEMETFLGEEYYPDLHKLNLGRTALVWILSHIKHDRLFLPRYICETVIESAQNAGYKCVLYSLDENLQPVWINDEEPGGDDIFYLVNFFGQLAHEDIVSYKKRYSNLIVDNAHAFYTKPVEGTHTIYSARKFFGVPDGAYVATDINASEEDLAFDRSVERVIYLVGRMEESANRYYMRSKEEEASFSFEEPKQMSLFTRNILRGVDYEAVKKKRCDNYETLKKLLPGENPFNRRDPECPYVFPYYYEDGINLRRYLIEKKIYIPTLWDYLIDELHRGSLEYDWSANLLCLPVDQRYDESDMNVIAKAIMEYIKQ